MAVQPEFEVIPHVRPFAGEDAVEHDVARRAVSPDAVVPENAVFLRAEPFDGVRFSPRQEFVVGGYHLNGDLLELSARWPITSMANYVTPDRFGRD